MPPALTLTASCDDVRDADGKAVHGSAGNATYQDHFSEENMMFKATKPALVADLVKGLYASDGDKASLQSNFADNANPFDWFVSVSCAVCAAPSCRRYHRVSFPYPWAPLLHEQVPDDYPC
jgi:hypothetical protein